MSSWAKVAKNSTKGSSSNISSNAAPFKIRRSTSIRTHDEDEEVEVQALASVRSIEDRTLIVLSQKKKRIIYRLYRYLVTHDTSHKCAM
jgi:hypothetical protein